MPDIAQHYKGKTVLVTGGAGAIGANLVRALIPLGAKVVVIDNLSSGFRENIADIPEATFIDGDIINSGKLAEAFSFKPDVVFHLAAFFANQNSIDHPLDDINANIVGTLRVLEESLKVKVQSILYANTSCMYAAEGNWAEDGTDVRHETPYSISKFTGEQYSKFFYKHYRLPVVSARIFNSYGPWERPGKYRNVIPNFFEKALRGESLTITGTGDETRSFTYVDDTVHGLLLAAASFDNSWQIYNIGSNKETKIKDLAEKINFITGNKAPILFAPRRDWDKTLKRQPNISKAEKRLGFTPTTTLDEGLARTHEWFKSIV